MIQVQEDNLERASKFTAILSTMISDGYLSVENAAREIMKVSKDLKIGQTIDEAALDKIRQEYGEQKLNEEEEF